MKIQTKYFGEIDIAKETCIQFPDGLPGFIDETEFILLELPGNSVFQILQSIKTVNIAFIVTNPYHFYQDYTFDLDDGILEKLKITSEQDVAILSIMTLKEPFHNSTINLKAPLIINMNELFGKQYILNDDKYSIKATIIPTATTQLKGE